MVIYRYFYFRQEIETIDWCKKHNSVIGDKSAEEKYYKCLRGEY
jgi:hypothetical protein